MDDLQTNSRPQSEHNSVSLLERERARVVPGYYKGKEVRLKAHSHAFQIRKPHFREVNSASCRGIAKKMLEKRKEAVIITDDDDVKMVKAVEILKDSRGKKDATALKEKKRKCTQEKMRKKGSDRSAIPSKSLVTQKRQNFGCKKQRKVGTEEKISPRLGASTAETEISGSSQAVIVTVDTPSEDEDFEPGNERDHEKDQENRGQSTLDEELGDLTIF